MGKVGGLEARLCEADGREDAKKQLQVVQPGRAAIAVCRAMSKSRLNSSIWSLGTTVVTRHDRRGVPGEATTMKYIPY